MLYKCKNCGGELHFDPAIGKLKCEFCDAVYDVSEYENQVPSPKTEPAASPVSGPGQMPEERLQASDDSTEISGDLRIFRCPHCAAEVVTDKDTVATTCVFCNTPLVLAGQMEGGFMPEQLLPFTLSKEQLAGLYEKYIAGKPFYPPAYSKANVIRKIRAVYLPFWLMDSRGDGSLQGIGEKTWTRQTDKWIITEHDVFSFHVEGSLDFSRVPVIASAKTPRNAVEALEPFDYSQLVPFNTGYLPGFLASRYDLDANACQPVAGKRMKASFEQAMLGQVDGLQGVQIQDGYFNLQPVKSHYVLLPVYLLFMDYDKGEDSLIAVNGQTGKIVGTIPVDKHKRSRYFLLWFVLLWLALFALVYTLID